MAKSNKNEDEQKSSKKAETMRERIEGASAKQDKKQQSVDKKTIASNKDIVVRGKKTTKVVKKEVKPSALEGKSFFSAFLWGFTLPLRWIWKPIRWVLVHIIPPYFKNSWKELKQVTWPTTRDTFKLTFVVLAFSLVFGGLVAAVDYGLDKIFKAVILN